MQLIYISQVGVEIVRGALALFVQHEFGIRAVFIVCADKQKRYIRNDSEISVAAELAFKLIAQISFSSFKNFADVPLGSGYSMLTYLPTSALSLFTFGKPST